MTKLNSYLVCTAGGIICGLGVIGLDQDNAYAVWLVLYGLLVGTLSLDTTINDN